MRRYRIFTSVEGQIVVGAVVANDDEKVRPLGGYAYLSEQNGKGKNKDFHHGSEWAASE